MPLEIRGRRAPHDRLLVRRVIAQACSLGVHLATAAAVAWLASTGVRRPSRSAAGSGATIAVFVAPPREASLVPGLNPIDISGGEAIAWRGSDSQIAIPGFRFDMRRIADRATLLFPFLTPGVSLDAFALSSRRRLPDELQDPFAPPIAGQSGRRPRRMPLLLSESEIQTIVDAAWARRERWTAFQNIARLMDSASADDGQLPDVLHRYVAQNALQPFADTSIPDARLWTELGIAADHVRFIAFVSGYASRHPSTKATTELLFLLDDLVQASIDAFSTLMSTDVAQDLRWTRDTNPEAYRLIGELQRFYRAQLQAKGLTTGDRLRRYFESVRLRILAGILRTTPHGYRSGDARFMVGEILWRQGDTVGALDAWHGIAVDPTDTHMASYRALLTALNGPGARVDVRVNAILRSDHARWLMASMDRLQQFGYRLDTY